MQLTIINTKGLSERSIVVKIVNTILSSPTIFIPISELFATYNQNNHQEEVFEFIKYLIDSGVFELDSNEKHELEENLKLVYQSELNEFNRIRSEILENVVYHFGPCTKGLTKNNVYIEPTIKNDNEIIGDSMIKCDFIFDNSRKVPVEFTECKTNIANVIPSNLSFKDMKKSDQKKVKYLDSVYHYLKENYEYPYIYFACYNLNYYLQLHNLQENWGYNYMNLINAKDIIEGKTPIFNLHN